MHVSASIKPARDDVAVWDPVVRIFHWSLVTAFAVAYLTKDEVLAVHVWAGYTVGGLILLRIIWGFVGPRHARFADFAYGPGAILAYLRDLLRLKAPRYLGHSPAGGAMVLTLLVGLSALVATGLVTHAIRNNAGPLAGWITAPVAPSAPTAAGISAPGDSVYGAPAPAQTQPRAPRPGRAWKEAHELIANVLLILIGLHTLGVIASSLAHRENLVRAMITGRKPADPH